MNEVDGLRRWFRFLSDTRPAYLETVFALPTAEIDRDRGASFPSLRRILDHLLSNYRWWILYAFEDRADQSPSGPSGRMATVDDANLYEREVSALISGFVDRLDPDQLDRTFQFRSGSTPGKVHTFEVREMLYHLVEEELQHRGELNALLWQMDVDPPVGAWDDWAVAVRANARSPASPKVSRSPPRTRDRSGPKARSNSRSSGKERG